MVVSIIGLLAAVALPAYTSYSDRARFAEAILASGSARSAIIIAAAAGKITSVNDFDAGAIGIPVTQAQAAAIHGLGVVDGAITITWMADGSSLAGETYILTAQGHLPPIQWAVTGTCVASGYC